MSAMSACTASVRQAEVENLHSAVVGDEDVLRLQVAMADAFVVRCAEAIDEFNRVIERALHGERAVLEDLAKVASLQ